MKLAILTLWFVAHMAAWTRPAPGLRPTPERVAYLAEVAADALAVAYDPTEAPLFDGPHGRARTAALLLSVASFESGFSRDVDRGQRRGDAGRSWCLMQFNLGAHGRVALDGDGVRFGEGGWSGADLVAERPRCFRAGLHLLRMSLRTCGDLTLYTSGRCLRGGGRESTHRLERARALWGAEPAGTEE